MAQLHKTVVLLLGDRVQDLHPMLEDGIQRRRLEDGGQFPDQLLGILPLTDHDLAQEVSAYDSDVERTLNRVNDALGIMQLTKERGLSVSDLLSLHIVVPSCDSEGRKRFIDVLERLHRICRANQFLFRLNAFVLMPGLFGNDETVDPLVYRARALATLYQLDQVMRSEAGPWQDNAPLDNIWLLDSRNARGEFIGYLPRALEMTSEMIISMATDDLEGLNEGAFVSSDDRCFRSFGFSQVWLPVGVLQRQIANHFVSRALRQQILQKERIHSNELLLSVKQYCHQDFLSVDHLLDQVAVNADGSSYFTPFDVDIDDEDLSIDAYLNVFNGKVEAYEGETALQAKQKLHERTEEEMEQIFSSIQQKLNELIQEHSNGSCYAQAFLEELLGEGAESALTEGPRFDEPTNLANLRDQLYTRFFENLGIPAYREELQDVNEKLSELRSEKQSLEAQAHHSAEPDDDQNDAQNDESEDEDASGSQADERLQAIESEVEQLENRRNELQEIVDLSEDAAEDVQVSQSLRQQAERERRSYLQDIEQRLRQAGRSLQEARERLSYLREERPHVQRNYFFHYPLGLLGGLLVALIILIVGGYLSFPGFLTDRETWQAFAVIVVGYGAFALWRYFKTSIALIHRTRQEIDQTEEEIESLKSQLRRGYRDLHQNVFTQYRDQIVLSEFQNVYDKLKEQRENIQSFHEYLQSWERQSTEYDMPDETLITIPLLSSNQFQEFANQLIVNEELDREAERALSPNVGDRYVSDLAWRGQDGADELARSLQEWGMDLAQRKLQGIGNEDVLFDERFSQLRERANLDPNEIAKLLAQVVPALQVQDEVGGGVQAQREIGVADAERSQIHDLLDTNQAIYSHYDLSRLTAFCYINPVALTSLSQLDYFCEAFEHALENHSEDLELTDDEIEDIKQTYIDEHDE